MDTYTVMIHGLPHTMQLTSDDADRLGGVKVKVDTKAAAAPANKARAADTKEA